MEGLQEILLRASKPLINLVVRDLAHRYIKSKLNENIEYTVKELRMLLYLPWNSMIYNEKTIKTAEDILKFPVMKHPPSPDIVPDIIQKFSVKFSTSGTIKRKILLSSMLYSKPMALIIAALKAVGLYREGRKLIWIDSGRTAEGLLYGSTAIGITMEKLFSEDFSRATFKDFGTILKKIKLKGGYLDGIIVFAPFLDRYLNIILDRSIEIREPFYVGWVGDIITKTDVERIKQALEERGVSVAYFLNMYGMVEGPLIGTSQLVPLKLSYLSEMRKIRIPCLLTIPIFATSNSTMIPPYVKRGIFNLRIATCNIIPLINYDLGDIVKILHVSKYGVIVDVMGRGMSKYGDGYIGSMLRVKGYTINTRVFLEVVENVYGKVSFILLHNNKDGSVRIIIYCKENKPFKLVLKKILENSKAKSSLSGLVTLYNANLLRVEVRDYDDGLRLRELLKTKYGKSKAPKVIYFREVLPKWLNLD